MTVGKNYSHNKLYILRPEVAEYRIKNGVKNYGIQTETGDSYMFNIFQLDIQDLLYSVLVSVKCPEHPFFLWRGII